MGSGISLEGGPWEFAGWLHNCCRDGREVLGMDEVCMALYATNKAIDLIDGALARGQRSPGLNLALLQLMQVKSLLLVEVSSG